MIALIAAALLCQDTIESLVRDLGNESIEVREKAQRELIHRGIASGPALRAALANPDLELRARAWATLLRVDRTEREKDHDQRTLTELKDSIPDRFPYLDTITWTRRTDDAA